MTDPEKITLRVEPTHPGGPRIVACEMGMMLAQHYLPAGWHMAAPTRWKRLDARFAEHPVTPPAVVVAEVQGDGTLRVLAGSGMTADDKPASLLAVTRALKVLTQANQFVDISRLRLFKTPDAATLSILYGIPSPPVMERWGFREDDEGTVFLTRGNNAVTRIREIGAQDVYDSIRLAEVIATALNDTH